MLINRCWQVVQARLVSNCTLAILSTSNSNAFGWALLYLIFWWFLQLAKDLITSLPALRKFYFYWFPQQKIAWTIGCGGA